MELVARFGFAMGTRWSIGPMFGTRDESRRVGRNKHVLKGPDASL